MQIIEYEYKPLKCKLAERIRQFFRASISRIADWILDLCDEL